MKVKTVRFQRIEEEIDLEYPLYLYWQDEMCNDEVRKVFPDYEIRVVYDTLSMRIEYKKFPQYEKEHIMRNLTTEKHFNKHYNEAEKWLRGRKNGK